MPRKKYEFLKGQEVEVKSIEKRIEEIWYVGKIVGISEEKKKRNKYLVEYPTSVKTPLADFIPYGRLRPPPPKETKNKQFQLNQVVDAFYNDGWWKGVVSKIPSEGSPWYTVFFRDEHKDIVFKWFNLRNHVDWIHCKWISSQIKEPEVPAQNVGSLLIPTPIYSSVCGTDMDLSQTPSERMDSLSTPNKTQAEMIAIAHNDGTFLAPIQTGSLSCGSDMDISQSPSGVGEILLEDCPSEDLTRTMPSRVPWQKKQHDGLPTTQMKELIAIAHNDGTFLAPIQTGSSSCSIDMKISQTPTGVREVLLEDCPSEALTSTIPNHDQLQKKQHAGLPTTQMKEPSRCSTEIKLHGIVGVGKQMEVFKRKRGQRIGSGPEHKIASEKSTVDQMETTQLLSMPVEDCLPLPTCLEKSNSHVENGNREVSPDNQLIPTDEAIAQIDASLDKLALLESSNAFDNLILGDYTTLDALIQYEEVSEAERGTHSADIAAISTSLMQHAEGHLHDETLPFVKSSLLWETFEGIEVLQLVPQHPHFRPLEQYDEELREGFAIGKLVSFVKLAEDILKAKLEEPKRVFENRLKGLAELEEHGFTVDQLQLRLKKFISIKDSYTELDINSKTVESELTEEKLKFDKLEDSVTQLKMKLETLMMDKEIIESDVADQQKMVAEFKESIESLKCDFDNMVASTFC